MLVLGLGMLSLTLLYVEDHADTRLLFNDFFNRRFKWVLQAEDGQEALEKFKSNNIDMIVTDMKMPVLSGAELVKSIRELGSEIPIFILSAYSEESVLSSLENVYYFEKPINHRKFSVKLQEVGQQCLQSKQS